MPNTGINFYFIILAQIFQRFFECAYSLDFNAAVILTEQPQDRHIDGTQLVFIVRYLPVVDDRSIKVIRKQQGSIERPAPTKAPSQRADRRCTGSFAHEIESLTNIFAGVFRVFDDFQHKPSGFRRSCGRLAAE